MLRTVSRAIALAVITLAALAAGDAQAQFYKDKTVNVLINSGAGGNSDSLGRLFLRHMQKQIPGDPNMVPRNMVGAGGLLGTNYLGEVAKPDGLTFGVYLINGGFAQLIGAPELRVKYSDFEFIAGIGTPIVSFIRKDVAPGMTKGADIVKAKEFWATGYNRDSTHDVRIRLTLDVIGAKYKMITGYSDAPKAFLAIMQNEAHFTSTSLGGYRNNVIPNMIKTGMAIMVWQYPIITADEKFLRNPSVADIPTFNEVYEEIYKKPPSGLTWRAFLQVQEAADLTRAIVAPKGTPQEAVSTLRNAVTAAAKTPEFQAEYEKLMGEQANIVSAEDGMRILKHLDNAPEDVRSFLRDYVK